MQFGSSGLPAIGPSSLTGTGLQFRISNNIALYEADLADTFNMFESPFLYASDTTRRIIIPTNDSMMAKFSTDGIWVKGSDVEKGEQQYYTGIVPVRLPLKAVDGAKPVDSAFVLVNDTAGVGDPVGTVVGGKSLIKVYEHAVNRNRNIDTLKNPAVPEIMMHGQSRKVVIDSNYVGGGYCNFNVLFHDVRDIGKLSFSDVKRCSAILTDTAKTYKSYDIQASIWYRGKIALLFFSPDYNSRKLWFRDVNNSIVDAELNGPFYDAYFEDDPDYKFPEIFYNGGKYAITWSEGVKIHRTKLFQKEKDLVFPPNKFTDITSGKELQYEELYNDIINTSLKSFAVELRYSQGKDEWIQFEYINLLNQSKRKYEHVIFKMTEKFNSDHSVILNKISSLCDCKTGGDYNDCVKEAEFITQEYMRMFWYFANHPESGGLTLLKPLSGLPNDAQNYFDFHSGWLCFNWAYFTQYFLKDHVFNHFKIQWLGIALPTGVEKYGFEHSWIGVSVPGCSVEEEDRVDLDPWADSTVKAFFPDEHYFLQEPVQVCFYGDIGLPIGSCDGWVKRYFDSNCWCYVNLSSPIRKKDIEWPTTGKNVKWPAWIIQNFSR